MTNLMFFYGIFRKDHPASQSLVDQGCVWVGSRTVPGYTLYTTQRGDGVWARPAEGEFVRGDLWEVPEQVMYNYLDPCEGHPHNYRRTDAQTHRGERCIIYVMQHDVENKGAVLVGEEWRQRMRLFVYGTLKRGDIRNHVLTNGRGRLAEKARLNDFVLYTNGGYPCAVPSPGDHVEGEVWEIPTSLVGELDAIEGHPDLFRRSDCVLQDGSEAVFYQYMRPVGNLSRLGAEWVVDDRF